MAETSYPFSGDSAGGGGKLVSQLQWQAMAHLWGPDRVDFELTNAVIGRADLPLNTTLSGSNLIISAGGAWVGGYYYKLDAPLTIAAPTNSGANPRYDVIALRASLTTGSVNVVILTGAASETPLEPTPKRILGDVWEMPLAAMLLPANNGTRLLYDRRRFPSTNYLLTPWSRGDVSKSLPPGSFSIDVDANGGGTHDEGYQGREGDMATRTLGKRRPYTPDLFTVTNKPAAANRTGFWRIIAPGTVQFAAQIINTSTTAVTTTAGWFMGITLPVTPSLWVPTQLQGVLTNNEARDGIPNLVNIVGQTSGTSGAALYYPNPTYLSEGLDGLTKIPGKSTLTISGVYETNVFEDRSLSG
ncbi:hypothetical protein ACFWNC_14555 [Streptomyces sp. NPDC058369]|uniref:hypothetical protein n=1 Tax=Streptomyces sp. NPDC058369 TaxID=3346462 RepID=UPI003650FAEB